MLSSLVSHEIGRHDPITQERYIPNRIAQLQSKGLAERVFNNPTFAAEAAAFDDPAKELILNGLQVRQIGKTNMFAVTLEGRDPARIKSLLEALLDEFKNQAQAEKQEKTDDTKEYAQQRLSKLKIDLEKLDSTIYNQLKTLRTIGPGGRNILEEQYVSLGNVLMQKQANWRAEPATADQQVIRQERLQCWSGAPRATARDARGREEEMDADPGSRQAYR